MRPEPDAWSADDRWIFGAFVAFLYLSLNAAAGVLALVAGLNGTLSPIGADVSDSNGLVALQFLCALFVARSFHAGPYRVGIILLLLHSIAATSAVGLRLGRDEIEFELVAVVASEIALFAAVSSVNALPARFV